MPQLLTLENHQIVLDLYESFNHINDNDENNIYYNNNDNQENDVLNLVDEIPDFFMITFFALIAYLYHFHIPRNQQQQEQEPIQT